ncbi:MAG: hydrogenase maturation nickel metallochaperone HypA [Tepidibacter sp.]|jgi:hydrogenase nickel incorporation protein HypA/HybF|uniref:hydrogenase maturation nickel metallochaperone HypA/HybF n=1 Tax=Tepidibacter sp. TaxID=2529387 RepID=UPI0025DE2235|nr:hydrogenase maturation nickel metallochaperone HypA [Tepidibacter sp.]MCT4508583.1 hydrogenase maturation nickel metallochaperone HypA [Tepidibacter sp.]
MHEITILVGLIKMVEKAAIQNNIEEIDTVVIQIGEMSSIVPKYMVKYFPNAAEDTLLENSKLKIEEIPANGLCHHCNKVFKIVKNKGKCPLCKADDWEMLSGMEFILKEIIVNSQNLE